MLKKKKRKQRIEVVVGSKPAPGEQVDTIYLQVTNQPEAQATTVLSHPVSKLLKTNTYALIFPFHLNKHNNTLSSRSWLFALHSLSFIHFHRSWIQ